MAVVGSSASGKSAVALELARLLDGEVLSVDSMQVYRGMDIGTAKPTAVEQARVRHHLINLVNPNEGFDAAAFRDAALAALNAVRGRGKTPILCGGTGFYFAALFQGLGTSPAGSPGLRAELEAQPTEQLLAELQQGDPLAYDRIDRKNRRRVIRAIEVVRLTGRPFSEQSSRADAGEATHSEALKASCRVFGLLREAADLRARIDARVEAMFAQGWVEETRRLMAAGLVRNRTAMQAIGYRQIIEHLQGERSMPATRELIRQKTWQLAKRQMTWFRHQMPVTWLKVPSAEDAADTAARIIQLLKPACAT